MRSNRPLLALLALVAASACSEQPATVNGNTDETPLANGAGAQDQGAVQISTKLSGQLYFDYVAPMDSPRAMALNLATQQYRVVASGIHPAVANDTIAYVHFCSALAVQLAVADADGFMSPLSPCVKRDILSDNSLQGPAISPDGKRVAILNHELQGAPKNAADDPYNLKGMVGAYQYSATQVYDLDGELIATFKDLGPATWTADGRLLMAGRGGDAGFGIYMASSKLTGVERIDDGRLKSTVTAIDAHPRADSAAFIFDGQLFEMALADGKPKRRYSHGTLLSGLAYSPDGGQIALVSADTLKEAMQMSGSGYPIFVYDNGDLHTIRLPFVVAGPLDWTR